MMTKFNFYVISALLLNSAVSAEIKVVDPWVRASTGPNAALFMKIENTNSQPAKLIKGEISGCARTELHTHAHEEGQMKMKQVDFIEVPSNGQKVLKPGEDHIMLMKLHQPLQEGDKVNVTLLFENEEPMDHIVPVKATAGD
ncbi:MAG: copper chaperone PCu(A)C [Alphaproteobacteria bacterium]|nr:copper chaperone PCu(A)C [Alphaproteobacteria bacterium]